MTLREKQSAFLTMVGKLIAFANGVLNKQGFCIEWYRSIEQEIKNIANGSSHLKDPNNCMHVKGLAIDFELLTDVQGQPVDYPTYRKMGEYWEKLGGRWGGSWSNFPDYGHFEYKDV